MKLLTLTKEQKSKLKVVITAVALVGAVLIFDKAAKKNAEEGCNKAVAIMTGEPRSSGRLQCKVEDNVLWLYVKDRVKVNLDSGEIKPLQQDGDDT